MAHRVENSGDAVSGFVVDDGSDSDVQVLSSGFVTPAEGSGGFC